MVSPELQRSIDIDQEKRLEFPKGKEALPAEIEIIFWDVDGTITEKDKVDPEIAKIILHSADNGIQHNFVTGRDRFWLVKNFKKILVDIAKGEGLDVQKILSKMGFYPELGLVSFDPISEEPKIFQEVSNHPLVSGTLRERLAGFFLQAKDLQKFEEEIPPRHYVIKDANGVAYLFPMIIQDLDTRIKLPDFIWSETKELIGTAEVVRDSENRITEQRRDKIILAANILKGWLEYLGHDKEISLSPVSTAINIAPILDGIPLDKDWAAGRILQDIQAKSESSVTLEELAQRSIGIGDGYADFLFSRPRIGKDRYLDVVFAFIGPQHQFHDDKDKTNNLVIQSLNYSGPKATLDVLKELKDRFIKKIK